MRPQQSVESRFPGSRTPRLVLLGALLLTAAATFSAARLLVTRDRLHFESGVQQTVEAIQQRMTIYTEMLVIGGALYGANEEMTLRAFREYVTRLRVAERYPGIQGIGFSAHVDAGQRKALIDRMRADGFPDFRIWPESRATEDHTIIYLEPLDARNRLAIGFNMATEPVRREAMERARDSGLPNASGRVTLVQETGPHIQPGFLLYVPVYRRGATPASLQERRRDLLGFVYSPFRTGDLLSGIFGAKERLPVEFRVFDGPDRAVTQLLYDSASGKRGRRYPYPAAQQVAVAGRTWTIEFAPGGTLAANPGPVAVGFLALAGVLISVILYRLSFDQAKAYAAAAKSAADLRLSEANLAASEESARALNESLEERVRARTAALQETNEQLEAFTYTVAHDLRAPLRAMQGFSQALLEDCGPQLDALGRDYAARVIAAAKKMDLLIQDLLSYSRLTRASLPSDVVSLASVIDRALQGLGRHD